MLDEESFEDALQTIRNYVGEIGDSVERPIEDQDPYQGFRCQHGDHAYAILGQPERAYFEIIYPVNIVQNVADNLKLINQEANETESGVSEQEYRKTATDLLESLSPEDTNQLQFHLLNCVLSPQTAHRTYTTAGGGLAGLQVMRKVFPHDAGFTLTEFNRSVQAVVSLGSHAGNALQQMVRLKVPGKKSSWRDLELIFVPLWGQGEEPLEI